jgi:alkyldihydroxyacetonephosphate synthase
VGPDPALLAGVEAGLRHFLGVKEIERQRRPALEDVALPAPRIEPPAALRGLFTADPFERALHTYGRSYRDLVRAVAGRFDAPPDLVALPRTEDDVVRILAHAAGAGIAVVPFGGGSSVCGGVEPDTQGAFERVISLDLRHLDRVLAVDEVSRAARIQAGIFGPALEDALRPRGLTLRHFPQSFEFSTLGGWIATRSGGHYATLHTHIDDFVEGLRIVTPAGILETPRLPGSGAGPDPARLFMGSEGILGVIVEAWMRVQVRPRWRGGFSATFAGFSSGASAVRALAQSGLHPANCRLLDPLEALLNGAGTGDRAVLIVGFESAEQPLDASLAQAAEICRAAGGEVASPRIRSSEDPSDQAGAADAWRAAFLRAPYLRDELVLMGLFVETFETAVTWDRFEALHAAVTTAAERAARDTAGASLVTCRLTHAYPDGVAPYFTVVTPAARGQELAQWDAIKEAVTGAMLASGGTTTHHHAVGRDFRPWYDRERPEGFAEALRAVKCTLDPAGILNPGVLLPVQRRA